MKRVFVTGAPRSGTTFLSDWLTELKNGYCVHEILRSLKGFSPCEVDSQLLHFAKSGIDRSGKTGQLAFMRWQHMRGKTSIDLLGLKEPNTWLESAPFSFMPPHALWKWVAEYRVPTVILVRHPADIVRSGKQRARMTMNWPNYDTDTMCTFWLNSAKLYRYLMKIGHPVLVVRWEMIILDKPGVKTSIEQFLDIRLPVFEGNECTPRYLLELRRCVHAERGVLKNQNKLDEDDQRQISFVLNQPIAWKNYSLQL